MAILREVPINDARAFLDTLRPTDSLWLDSTEWVFRGVADASWALVPSILRAERWRSYLTDPDPPKPDEHDLAVSLAEYSAVSAFYQAADREGLAIPDDAPVIRSDRSRFNLLVNVAWPPHELLAVIGLAQHYGVPTRLLDWSWKPLVSAYFACADVAMGRYTKSTHIAVYALRLSALTKLSEVQTSDATTVSMPILEQVIAPQATNPNLAAQAGLFTLVREAFDATPLEMTIEGLIPRLESTEPKEAKRVRDMLPIILKLTLPVAEAPRLFRLIGLEGISAASIFPGYEGVVDSIEERKRWKK